MLIMTFKILPFKKGLVSYLAWLDLASELSSVSKTVHTGRFQIQVILSYASEALE